MTTDQFVQQCAICRQELRQDGDKQLSGFRRLKILEVLFERNFKNTPVCEEALMITERVWESAVQLNNRATKEKPDAARS